MSDASVSIVAPVFRSRPCRVIRAGYPRVGDRVAYPTDAGEIYGTVRDLGGATVRVAWATPGVPELVLIGDVRLESIGDAA